MFESALEKIRWAEEQTARLEADIASFLGMDHYEIREHLDPQTGWKEAVLYLTREIPIEWSVRFGGILYDLRSALDHAVTDLTKAHNGHPLERTEFPVFKNEADYSRVRRNGEPDRISGLFKIRGVSDRAKATIKWLQPFEVEKRNPGEFSALGALHDLNIIDKHRTIHILRYSAAGGELRLLRNVFLPSTGDAAATFSRFCVVVGEMKNATKLGKWLPVEEPKDAMDVEIKIDTAMALGEDEPTVAHLKGTRIIDLCRYFVRRARVIIGKLSA